MIKLFNQSIGRLSLTKTKNLLHASLLAGALVALLSSSGQALGQAAVPNDPFVILLKGIYQPVVNAPNLGLSLVDLNDGSFSTTKIYPVSGTPGSPKKDKAIGNFYVQFNEQNGVQLCAYHVPGGSFTAVFTEIALVPEDDGTGGLGINLVGTAELDILEATGIYRSFVGGHIHMVDVLHLTFPDIFNEYCFCHISRP